MLYLYAAISLEQRYRLIAAFACQSVVLLATQHSLFSNLYVHM